MSRTCSKWSDERVDELKRLWARGVSASEIARIFNRGVHLKSEKVTRSAVLGKVHRLGLAGRTVDTRRPGPTPRVGPRPPRKVVTPPPPQRPTVKPEPYAPIVGVYSVPLSERVGLADLADNQCRWPIGDPQDDNFHFCDQEQVPGLPYCEHHRKIAYEPIKPRRRRTNGAFRKPKPEVVYG